MAGNVGFEGLPFNFHHGGAHGGNLGGKVGSHLIKNFVHFGMGLLPRIGKQAIVGHFMGKCRQPLDRAGKPLG